MAACVATLPLSSSSSEWTSSLPYSTLRQGWGAYNPTPAPPPQQKPRLRLPLLAAESSAFRFTTDERTSQKPRSLPIPAAPTTPAPAPAPVRTGRKRSPSFSAGPGLSLAASSSINAPSPPPCLTRPSLSPPPPPPAPQSPGQQQVPPFLLRTYPTPDARKRLVARSLLRIHAVGRPRPPCAFPCARGRQSPENGYEDECGGRGYVPSRLSGECA
ncbi:hypothetical protein C8F01DRAFT_1137626 [Mycena amicta]|nr:hypothetical protein C8F01DRAFT_1137626 [Mycena amicta]